MASREALKLFLRGQGTAPAYVTPREIADDLRLVIETVYKMIRDGTWPYIRVGGSRDPGSGVLQRQQYRIPTKDYLKWRKANLKVGVSPEEEVAAASPD